MGLTIDQRKALVAHHKSALAASGWGESLSSATDVVLNMGQSNAGASAINTDSVVVTDPGIAYQILRENHPRYGLHGPLRNGANSSPLLGKSSYLPAFAQRWHDLTGRKSLHCSITATATPLIKAGTSVHWTAEPHATSLIGGFEVAPGFPRNQIITDAFDTLDLYPRFARGLRIGLWCQGEADASQIAIGEITGTDYRDALDGLFSHLKSTWALDHFLIFAIGRLGTSPEEVDRTEAAGRRDVRAAQFDVAAMRADTFVILNAAKEKGSPFNSLTVDDKGDWADGWAYHADGQHYLPGAYKVMGHTGAWNAAIQLGFVTGDLIGMQG